MEKSCMIRVNLIGLTIAAMFLQACGDVRSSPASTPAASAAPTTAATSVPVTILPTTEPTQVPSPAPTEMPTETQTPQPVPTETIAETPDAPAATSTDVNTGAKPALQKLVDGLEKPTYLTYSGDDNGFLYITEQPGRIRVLRDGQLLETPFLDLTDRVGDSGNEQGLLSVAFSPNYKQSRKFYVDYTNKDGDTIVSGFIASADGLTAGKESEWVVLKIDQPYQNHNGGQLKFGPDGMLYIGMGDGGSQGDPQNRAQNAQELLGKILRIDVSQSSEEQPYAIPPDNPGFGAGARPELWAIGLRNPWRFSFDRATGDMFIADVGQNEYEEVDFQPAGKGGENYGWKLREGFEEYTGPKQDNFTDPIHEYQHGGDGCSVTGGYVYRGTAVPSLAGSYVYGDYCSGKIWWLKHDASGEWTNEDLFSTGYSITSFGEDEAGELYVLDRSGAIYKLVGE